jgi:hypothetical protein
LIDVFLSVKPTPTIGAPPTDTPGDPKALLLPPVVCTPPMLFVVPVPAAPFVVVPPPIPVDEPDEPNPPLELESVPPIGDVEEPLFPNGELDDPDPKEDPLLPNPDPEEPSEELPLPGELPGDPAEDPKGDEDPIDPAVPVPVLVLAPVGVMPLCCTDWPNKPIVGTFCSPL